MQYNGKVYKFISIPTKLEDKIQRMHKAIARRQQILHISIENSIRMGVNNNGTAKDNAS